MDSVERRNPRSRMAERERSGLATLPTPHPLDFCWWFADETIERLVRQIACEQPGRGPIVILGAPRLFGVAAAALPRHSLVLLDQDPVAVASAQSGRLRSAICVDLLREALPLLSASVVIADPPWYPEEMVGFLWAARQFSRRGGRVLMSVPGVGTRPGVAAEWRNIITWARRAGLTLERYEAGFLKYLMPPFERNAFRAAGIPMPPDDWRSGDLATFLCDAGLCRKRPRATPKRSWYEAIMNGVRIRVAVSAPQRWGDPRLRRLVRGNVLPTVSRREPVRRLVNVWTSGNRVFRTAGPCVFKNILRAVSLERDPVLAMSEHFRLTPTRAAQVENAAAQARELFQVEGQELASRPAAFRLLDSASP
jgi:hypothetical protein